jgi:RNA polymerase sigma factor (sigma-70 family)
MRRPHRTAGTSLGRDPDAFEAFYREHLETVRRFVSRRVGDVEQAADLTADVFVQAIESADRYDPSLGPPGAWLTGIARHVVAAHLRDAGRQAAATRRIDTRALLDEDSAARIAERIDAEAPARALFRSLQDLPDGQRAVVELVAVDGLSVADAARALGIAPTAARVRYHRARHTLRRSLPLTPTEVTP